MTAHCHSTWFFIPQTPSRCNLSRRWSDLIVIDIISCHLRLFSFPEFAIVWSPFFGTLSNRNGLLHQRPPLCGCSTLVQQTVLDAVMDHGELPQRSSNQPPSVHSYRHQRHTFLCTPHAFLHRLAGLCGGCDDASPNIILHSCIQRRCSPFQ